MSRNLAPHLFKYLKHASSPPQDFSKEVEAHSSLKSSVFNEGNQLLRLKKADTGILRAELARVEAQWAELLTRIPVVQEKLHQVMCFTLASCAILGDHVYQIEFE